MESDSGQEFSIILNYIAFEIPLLILSLEHSMKREIQILDHENIGLREIS